MSKKVYFKEMTTEGICIGMVAFDEYMKWIRDEINPRRIQNNFDPVSDEEAKKCYELIKDFLEGWTKPALC